MMKNLFVLLSVFAVLKLTSCRPSAPTPGAFTKDNRVELPGSEKISKRSVADYTKILAAAPNDDSLENAQNGSPVGETKALESNEDFIEAQDKIAFHPLPVFRKRSVNEKDNDEMEIAENGLVFLPLLPSRNSLVQRKRFQRSAEDALKNKILSNGFKYDNDLEGAETIIFKPVFRSQIRPVRSVPEKESLRSGDGLQGDDDMVVAENGLIFRPLFRTRQGNNY